MTTEPSPDPRDVIARHACPCRGTDRVHDPGLSIECAWTRSLAGTVLAAIRTDPAVADAVITDPAPILAALTRAGVLHEEEHCAEAYAAHAEGDYKVYACSDFDSSCPPPRLVTPWRESDPAPHAGRVPPAGDAP